MSSSATDLESSPSLRLVDVVQALITRGYIEKAIQYQIEIPLLLGIPVAEAMEKTVEEITEFFDSIQPPPSAGIQ